MTRILIVRPSVAAHSPEGSQCVLPPRSISAESAGIKIEAEESIQSNADAPAFWRMRIDLCEQIRPFDFRLDSGLLTGFSDLYSTQSWMDSPTESSTLNTAWSVQLSFERNDPPCFTENEEKTIEASGKNSRFPAVSVIFTDWDMYSKITRIAEQIPVIVPATTAYPQTDLYYRLEGNVSTLICFAEGDRPVNLVMTLRQTILPSIGGMIQDYVADG